MAITILLQKNKSEKICLTKNVETVLTIDATLKEQTSIIDPSFIIEGDLSILKDINYLTVADFGRSYFVLDMLSITNDLVELNCHVDVLSSFAEEIKLNQGIVYRQETKWNLYLNDGVIQAYQNPIVTTQVFPKGFTAQNYVLVCAGSRNIGGVAIGDGGALDPSFPDEYGSGGNESKTTSGLINYCREQLGKPYWFGTFGNIASQDLLDMKRNDYPTYYPIPGTPDFTSQFGERVHDCVGLIKGYRWSDSPTSTPVYVANEDVDVRGLYSQCSKLHGQVDFSHTETSHLLGMCVFDSSLTHVGVYVGNGKIIEAQGHAYGVVENNAYDRRGKFTLWGVPDWLKVTTPYDRAIPTTITAQPSSISVPTGESVVFSVSASGYKLTYKWQYQSPNGTTWYSSTATGNKTHRITFEARQSLDGYKFRCVVTDYWGIETISDVALLTVT